MTKDEIKKAYEICASANDCSSCNDCPDCTNCASAAALNLIIEQEKEIERLEDDYAKLQEQFAQYQMASDKEIMAQRKQAKIDVLNKAKEKLDSAPNDWAYTTYIDELIEEVENDK